MKLASASTFCVLPFKNGSRYVCGSQFQATSAIRVIGWSIYLQCINRSSFKPLFSMTLSWSLFYPKFLSLTYAWGGRGHREVGLHVAEMQHLCLKPKRALAVSWDKTRINRTLEIIHYSVLLWEPSARPVLPVLIMGVFGPLWVWRSFGKFVCKILSYAESLQVWGQNSF